MFLSSLALLNHSKVPGQGPESLESENSSWPEQEPAWSHVDNPEEQVAEN